MADQRIVDYIRQQSAAGFSRDAIKKALQEAGWFDEEIEEAFSDAFSLQGSEPVQQPRLQEPQPPESQKPQEAKPQDAGSSQQPMQPTQTQPETQLPQSGSPQEQPAPLQTPPQEPSGAAMPLAFFISLAAGALLVINSIISLLSIGDIMEFFVSGFSFSILSDSGIASPGDLPFIGIVAGAGVIIGAFLLMIRPEKEKVTSLLFVIISVISILLGNGYMIGGIVGLFAGITGFLRK